MRTLKNQLLLVNIATTGAAVLLSLVLLFSAEQRNWRNALIQDMGIKADIIGTQCTAALTFSSPKDAEEILGALRADPQILYASVYARDGRLFAAYRCAGAKSEIPAAAPPSGHSVGADDLVLTRSITLDGEQAGTISIRVSLERFRTTLYRHMAISAAALVLALLTAWILLSRLQRTVTAPVTGLVRLMEGVSRDKDFSRRAGLDGPSELVSLSMSFNEMLTTIQSRDRDLERSLAELQAAYGKLQDLDRLKSDFISTVSHELRTPVTSIRAFVEVLATKENLDPERRKRILVTISHESERLGRLINDLLDLSRIESGVLEWRDRDTDIDEVVREVIAGILPLAQNKGISIEAHQGEALPHILADRDRLVQVMMNLLSNAIKFTPSGGKITVTTVREASPAGVSVSVADTGVGISPDDLGRIFERFHRSRSPQARSVEGTGLGLAISRSIVEHYGGGIRATSGPGKGSVFVFFLPEKSPVPGIGNEGLQR